jgi:molybdenum cofactor synthesis domain-containing protein
LKLGILAIGNEIVKGRTLNSNVREMADYFTKLGYEINFHMSCMDISEEICKAITFLLDNCDVIITTGGLGPTMDDISIKSISQCLKKDLSFNELAMNILKKLYKERNLELTEERMKMAKMPEGAKILENDAGTAPGMYIEFHKVKIFSVPGVPKEMRSMLPKISFILGSSHKVYGSKQFRVRGIMESSIAPVVKDVWNRMNNEINIKTHPESFELNNPILIIEFYGYGNSENELNVRIDETYKELSRMVKDKFNIDI